MSADRLTKGRPVRRSRSLDRSATDMDTSHLSDVSRVSFDPTPSDAEERSTGNHGYTDWGHNVPFLYLSCVMLKQVFKINLCHCHTKRRLGIGQAMSPFGMASTIESYSVLSIDHTL